MILRDDPEIIMIARFLMCNGGVKEVQPVDVVYCQGMVVGGACIVYMHLSIP
jgi:hypothetical protein